MEFRLYNKDNPNVYDTKEGACFVLSFVGNRWEVEKIKEFPIPGSSWISYLTFKGSLVNTLGMESFIKRNMATGAFSIELFPPAYQAIHSHMDRSRLMTVSSVDPEFPFVELIDREGKVHILVREGSTFKADLYHEVYNPNAADPTVPELREFIEHQE
ncbi:MAG: hypothetical protein AAB317_01585 [Nitrospirota bacterium]